MLAQLEHLREYPSVAAAISVRELRLHGLWFDIMQLDVQYYEEHLGRLTVVDAVNETRILSQLMAHMNSGIPNFESAETARAYLAVLLRDLDDAIICTTADGVAEIWNPGAERLFGYAFDEVIGRPLDFFGNPHPQKFLPSVQAVGPVEKYRTIAIRKDDSPIEISLAVCPVRDGNGDITSVVYTAKKMPWNDSNRLLPL